MGGGEDLRDGAAAVVGDEVGLFDTQRVHDLGDHPRLGRKRDILRRSDFGIAEPHEVDGNAAPSMLDEIDDMAPVISVEGHPVDKERGRALPLLEKSNTPGLYVGKAAVGMKGCNIHGLSC